LTSVRTTFDLVEIAWTPVHARAVWSGASGCDAKLHSVSVLPAMPAHPRGAFIPNKLQKNDCLSDELLITAKTLGLVVTPGLGLRQPFADAAGQKSDVWKMNRQAETAAVEIAALFEHLFGNGGGL